MVSAFWLYMIWTRNVTNGMRKSGEVNFFAVIWILVTAFLTIVSLAVLVKAVAESW
jgi:hypothetical protein